MGCGWRVTEFVITIQRCVIQYSNTLLILKSKRANCGATFDELAKPSRRQRKQNQTRAKALYPSSLSLSLPPPPHTHTRARARTHTHSYGRRTEKREEEKKEEKKGKKEEKETGFQARFKSTDRCVIDV